MSRPAPGPPKKRRRVEDLRGAARLAVEGTRGITDVVETMHRTIAAGPSILGRPLEGPARLLTRLAYAPMRKATSLVGASVDAFLAALGPLLGEGAPAAEHAAYAATVAALNGVVGDYLEETGNPLAIPLRLRHEARADGETGARLVVVIHGSAMNGAQQRRRGHDHGEALARDLGYEPIYVEYNSGRHISRNGEELSLELEALLQSWPVPVSEVVLLGHSMGGLVARSACAYAERSSPHPLWRERLRALVCLGSPHHGAPLERGGNWIDVLLALHPYSAPLARLGKIRSAGVTDLRHGAILEEHWKGRDRFARHEGLPSAAPLPAGVACYAVAATSSPKADGSNDSALRGDGLVPVASALGRHPRAELTLGFRPECTFIAHEAGHLDLLDRADVYEQIRAWLAGPI